MDIARQKANSMQLQCNNKFSCEAMHVVKTVFTTGDPLKGRPSTVRVDRYEVHSIAEDFTVNSR